MSKHLEITAQSLPGSGYWSYTTWAQRRARRKTDWAGISLGCAFNPSVDYHLRLQAQRRFYLECRQIQSAAAQVTEASTSTPGVKPQIGPCYTRYPATLAAHASIGLTGFLEFHERAPERALANRLSAYLEDPAKLDGVRVDPEIYKDVAQGVTHAVQTRLLLHALARTPGMLPVETYRLFSACQQDLRFRTLAEIIEAVVIYGDVLPDWSVIELHPGTRQLLERIEETSRVWSRTLNEAESHEWLDVGELWVKELLAVLAPHLPGVEDGGQLPAPPAGAQSEGLYRLGKPQQSSEAPERFEPLESPSPPALMDRRRQETSASELVSQIAEQLQVGGGEDSSRRSRGKEANALKELLKALRGACGQERAIEDIRSDLLEEMLRRGAFVPGLLEGNPIGGYEVRVPVAGEATVAAEVFDRAVELSGDDSALEKLLAESEPIIRQLKRVLYPNLERVPETTRLCTGGSLDGSRLPLADCSTTIFKRSRIRERPDPRGRPLLVLLCDGSGSLHRQPMKMTKLLAASWLASTARTDIQVLAAIYHSATISGGIGGPLVRWIYHPEKTPAASRSDAVRAVVSLADEGSGGQADAPSLQLVMNEALRLSRGRSIYLVLISDTRWIRSVGGESGQAEVYAVLEYHLRRLKERLHVTLVALGVEDNTGFEDLLDAVVRVSDEEMADATSVARKISMYVAGCMRERRKQVDRSGGPGGR